MFKNISMAGTGGSIVIILKILLPLFGIELPEGSIESTVAAVFTLVGTIWFIWGQLRRPDLTAGIIRNETL